jgi:ribonuclease III
VKFLDSLKSIFASTKSEGVDKLTAEFESRFGYRFKNIKLLAEALTHRSYTHYAKDVTVSNERMEFLGDSVLGLIVGEELFKINPNYNEGDLTKTKSLMVNEITLSKIGIESGLNELILMSPEEEKSGGRQRNSIVSDAVEAVIAAIYLDGGLAPTRRFVRNILISHTDEILNDSTQRNFKGELLEYLQGQGIEPPYYEVISENGPDHDKTFEVAVFTNGKKSGFGTGSSKKDAEQKAAREAISNLLREEAKRASWE